jgi:hypothetical protein
MLRFGRMSIVVSTDKGKFGCSHTFEPGLNVLRANNSAGKSTVLRGLIYVLGLEGAFSPSHEVPLPHVLTEYIDLPGENALVKEASIAVEVSNAAGETITVSRSISAIEIRILSPCVKGRRSAIRKLQARPVTSSFGHLGQPKVARAFTPD